MSATLFKGEVKFIKHTLVENVDLKSIKVGSYIYVSGDADHKQNEYHEIIISVNAGFINAENKIPILTVNSCSLFQIKPYSPTLFAPHVPKELIVVLMEMSNMAIDHNLGMFAALKRSYGYDRLNPTLPSKDDMTKLIYNFVNKIVLN